MERFSLQMKNKGWETMENEYSERFKKLTKKQPGVIWHVATILLIIILVFVGAYSYKKDMEFLNQPIDSYDTFTPELMSMGYQKLTPIFLSEPFASSFDDSILSCFAIDHNYETFIVSIKADDMDKYQDLIDYTYDETITDVPEQVVFIGTSQPIDDEMMDFANDSFKIFWGIDPSEEVNTTLFVGNYYLDTTQERSINYMILALIALAIIVTLAFYIDILRKAKKKNSFTEMTLGRYQGSTLRSVDHELINSKISFPKKKLYFTNNYIVCGSFGFDLIPYDEVEQVYGADLGKDIQRIMVVTRDGINHPIAELVLNKTKESSVFSQILDFLNMQLPDVKYGFDDGSFSVVYARDSLDVDQVFESDGSNVFLGLIGSIIGAALGGLIWVIIGKLGFIAGIAGFFMMTFSIKGYHLVSGVLDKKGKIISILVAIAMIFVAQYSLYVLEYCDIYFSGNYSMQNLIHAFKNVGTLLSSINAWSSFFRDLAIGLGLSIWSCYGIIKSAFSGR